MKIEIKLGELRKSELFNISEAAYETKFII